MKRITFEDTILLLKKKRVEKGYNQEDIANFLGVSRNSVGAWEKEIPSKMPSKQLFAYAEIVGVKIYID